MSFPLYKGIIAITLCFSYVYGGQFCLSCSDAPDMASCRQITQCKNEEVCFVHKYSNDRDQIRYDMGCSYPEICLKDEPGHLFGKRSDHNHILCQQCCNDTHICNADIPCNGHMQDEVCLSCSGVETPKACFRNTSCNKEEVCYMHKYRIESGKLLYDFGCKPASLCVHTYNNVFGRQISEGKHQICEECCHGSHLCNRNITCNHFNQNSVNGSCSTTYECRSNLLCLTGTCKCQSDEYYWGIDRCMSRKAAYIHCEKSNECQESLKCINLTCQCIDTEYWNGSSCILRKNHEQSCLLSTECKRTLYCNHQHCTCDHNDYWTGHVCSERKSQGAYCNSTNQCKPTLFCENSTCLCPNGYYWSSSECLPSGSECAYIESSSPDGVYEIFPDSKNSVLAYCVGPGRKWTVIQRRFNGSVSFEKTWKEFKYGFGSAFGELWLGNEYMHLISNQGPHEISIKIVASNGDIKYANYSMFKISDESSGYVITITGYSGNAGNTHIAEMAGARFSTKDHTGSNTCVNTYHVGWWYNACFHSNLNFVYGSKYFQWDSAVTNIRQSTMMIRKR